MNIATIEVMGTSAKIRDRLASITAGMVGATVTFVYSGEWAASTKTAVFRYQSREKSVLGVGEVVTIPPEMLSESGEKLQVGLYGVSPDGQAATPTNWVSLGRVQPGATVSNDPDANPVLPVWAQILAMIGQLGALETTEKSSLVAAINELVRRGTSGLPSFDDGDEGKLLFVRKGAAESVDLGDGLEIVEINGRPTLRLTVVPDTGEPEEPLGVVEASVDEGGILHVYLDGTEVFLEVDADGLGYWPGLTASLDADGYLIIERSDNA